MKCFLHGKLIGFTLFAILVFFTQPQVVMALGMSPGEFWIDEPLDYTSSVALTTWLGHEPAYVQEMTLRPNLIDVDAEYFTDSGDLVIPAGELGGDYTFYVTPGHTAGGDYVGYFTMDATNDSADASGSTGARVTGSVTIKVHFSVVDGNELNAPRQVEGGGGGADIPTDTTDENTETETETEEGGEEVTAEENADELEIPTVPASDPTTEDTTPEEEEESTDPIITEEVVVLEEQSEEELFDFNGDGFLNDQDVVQFFERFLTSSKFTLADLVALVASSHFTSSITTFAPPVTPGPPLATDDVVFYFEKANETGRFRFQLASAQADVEDRLTLYLLVDTGITGLLAEDLTFQFDPDMLQFSSVDTRGTLFPYASGLLEAENGTVRYVAATPERFVGTRGYIGSFIFQPLEEGKNSLAFSDVQIYQGEITGEGEGQDLTGKLLEEKQIIDDSEVSQPVCLCLTSPWWPICLLLFLTALGATVLLFLLRKLIK